MKIKISIVTEVILKNENHFEEFISNVPFPGMKEALKESLKRGTAISREMEIPDKAILWTSLLVNKDFSDEEIH